MADQSNQRDIGLVQRCSGRSAFTLVELLVVIGIIAVLIGILLPALGRARASARSVACMANLRSIGQTIAMYTAQNKGSLPYGWFNGADPTDTLPGTGFIGDKAIKWPALLMTTLNPKFDPTFNGSNNSGADTSKLKEMFSCPEVPGAAQRNANATASSAGNGLSHYFCHPRLMPSVGKQVSMSNGGSGFTQTIVYPQPFKASQIKRPSEIALVFDGSLEYDATIGMYRPAYDMPIASNIDGGQMQVGAGHTYLLDKNYGAGNAFKADDSIDMTTYGASPSPADVNKDSPGNTSNIRFRHMKETSANVLMCDGHVESFKFDPAKPSNSLLVTTMKRKNINVNLITYRKYP